MPSKDPAEKEHHTFKSAGGKGYVCSQEGFMYIALTPSKSITWNPKANHL